MARIAGVTIPNNKRLVIALTYVYGIGPTKAGKICEMTQVDPKTRVKDLAEADLNKIRDIVEKQNKVEGELRREVVGNIKRLKEISSYRGARHSKNLPSRGQRTKTNSRTVRGNVRRTTTSGKRTLTKT